LIAGLPIDGLLVRRFLEIPQNTGVHRQGLLTGLSASFRARCYEKLVCRPNEGDVGQWHAHGIGGAPTSHVTKESGLDLLIRMLSDALTPKQGRPAAGDSRSIVDLTHFLTTAQRMNLTSMSPKSRRRDATAVVRCQC
jgi:hypothetical protein